MPSGSLVRISYSLSRNGTCKTNLRGYTATTPYDYVLPSRTITSLNVDSVTTTDVVETWTNQIQRAFNATSENTEVSPSITYPNIVSTAATDITILIRIYLNPRTTTTPPLYQYVFRNGTAGDAETGSGYDILVESVETEDPGEYDINVYFHNCADDKFGKLIKISSANLSYSQWYSYSIRIDSSSFLTAFENGTNTAKVSIDPITTPAGSTSLFLDSFYGRITDFALIESSLTDSMLDGYATAPYI